MLNITLTSAIKYIVPLLLGYAISRIESRLKKEHLYNDAIKCLLRSSMTNVYFAYKEIGAIPYYCKQGWYYMYEAYKGLGGNSFIDDIKKEIDALDVKN
jgi:hypothetical protein